MSTKRWKKDLKNNSKENEERFEERLQEIVKRLVSLNNENTNTVGIKSETTLLSEVKGVRKSPVFDGEIV